MRWTTSSNPTHSRQVGGYSKRDSETSESWVVVSVLSTNRNTNAHDRLGRLAGDGVCEVEADLLCSTRVRRKILSWGMV